VQQLRGTRKGWRCFWCSGKGKCNLWSEEWEVLCTLLCLLTIWYLLLVYFMAN